MERDTNQIDRALCRLGCGFYGSDKTDALCSKCYKDALKRKHSRQTPHSTQPGCCSPTSSDSSANISTATTSGDTSSSSPSEEALSTASPSVPASIPEDNSKEDSYGMPECTSQISENKSTTASLEGTSTSSEEFSRVKVQKKKNRCITCRRNVGLLGFECRCGGLFCGAHRYAVEHGCSIDYRKLGAQEIKRNNPLVIATKIDKI